MLRVRSQQDLGAGILLIVIGVGGLVFGRDLAYGSPAKMGPGFFPTILSWLILAFGVGISVRGIAIAGPGVEAVRLRPILFVTLAILAFALLIEQVGLALSVGILVVLAGLARADANLARVAVLAVALAISAVLVFVYGLGQSLPAWWGR